MGADDERNASSKPEWLAIGDARNPFPIPVVDCRSIALKMMSTTSDPQVAASFLALRHSGASEFAGKRPARPLATGRGFAMACSKPIEEGALFVAPAMEHKWDIYASGGKIYARRSWIGQLIHVASLQSRAAGTLLIDALESDADAVCADPGYAAAQLHFLLSVYVAGRLRPFPIPPTHAGEAADAIAWAGWSLYGRAAHFACALDAYVIGD